MKATPFVRLLRNGAATARVFSAAIVALIAAHSAQAALFPLDWDGGNGVPSTGPNGGGNGTWDTMTTANWWDVSTSSDVVWPDTGTDNDAVFGGTPGTVTVASVTVNDITFGTTGYTVASGTITLNGTTPTITAGSGIVATISSDIAGTAGLTKSGIGSLTINASSTYSGTTTVNAGSLVLKKAADSDPNLVASASILVDNATLKPDATTRNLYVGTNSVAHDLTVQNAGQVNNFTGLYLGTTATSNGNTVLFTGTGTVVACVNNSAPNKNLRIGEAGSNNTLTVSAGAAFNMPKGNGANDQTIGNSANANGNSMTVTGTNTIYTSGAPMNVGVNGANNQMVVSAGGSATPQRLLIGTGATGTGNSVTVTGTNSKYTVNSGTNAIFEIGSVAGANNNSMSVAAGGLLSVSGGRSDRDFAIGRAGNSNYLEIKDALSAMTVSFTLPVSIGGLVNGTGPGTIVDGGTGNHLDVSNGASVTLTSTSLYLLGTDSAFNLGDGSGISTATVGASAAFTAGVYLRSASGRLNFNSGRLIAGTNGALVSGAGQIVLTGPAHISTTQAASTIGCVISGGGSLTKEGTGTLTLAAATNTYSGATHVDAGLLEFTSPNPSNDTSTVTIATLEAPTAGRLKLSYTGTDTVGELWIDGVKMADGIYGSSSSDAPFANQLDGAFDATGTGTLTVVPPPPYAVWAQTHITTGNPSADATEGGDPDHDGSNNLSEFAFNGDPLNGADNGKVYLLTADNDTSKKLILTVAVRASTPVFAGDPSPTATNTGDSLTYTIMGSTSLIDGFLAKVNVIATVPPAEDPDAGTGYEYRSFSLDGSDGLTTKGFLRAMVTSP